MKGLAGCLISLDFIEMKKQQAWSVPQAGRDILDPTLLAERRKSELNLFIEGNSQHIAHGPLIAIGRMIEDSHFASRWFAHGHQ